MKKYILAALTILCALPLPGYSEQGKSGWLIFDKVQRANTRPTVSSNIEFGNLCAALRNPALLGARSRSELFVLSESGFADDAMGGMMYGQAFKNGGMLMAGGFYYDAGKVELNWIEGGSLITDEVSLQKDSMGILAYGLNVSRSLYAGLALKAASSDLAERVSAQAYACDVGLAFAPAKRMTVGLSVQNLGESGAFYVRKNPLPLTGSSAITYTVEKGSLYVLTGLSGDYNFVDDHLSAEAGLEIGFGAISVNGAYAVNADEGNILMGIDLCLGDLEFAYSYAPGTYLNPVQKMNVGWKF